jgi:hypothetical protein
MQMLMSGGSIQKQAFIIKKIHRMGHVKYGNEA